MTIEALAQHIPSNLLQLSGSVFYSGRNAFLPQRPLYILGLNPGGCPEELASNTIGHQVNSVITTSQDDWSAYRDESWQGAQPGKHGMAPRVLHLLEKLRLNAGTVPASNLVFVRSRREAGIRRNEMQILADCCWPFHQAVIELTQPRAILCFGKTTGMYVRERLIAHELIGEFVERNNRRWKSQSFTGMGGIKVIVGTHPSIADWCAPNTDISQLVADSLQ